MNSNQLKNNNLIASIYVDDVKNTKTLSESLYSITAQEDMPDLLVLYSKLSDKDINVLKNLLDDVKVTVFYSEKEKDKEGKEVDVTKEKIISADKKLNYLAKETTSDSASKLFNETFNYAIDNKYELMTIIEPEDVIGKNWIINSKLYLKEDESLSIAFPIVRLIGNGAFIGLMNEATWAENFAEEAGKLDMNLISRFNCVIPTGAVYDVAKIRDDGEIECKDDGKYYPMKESFKLSHYYEFFLRMIYNDLKTITVPRIGYECRSLNTNEYKATSFKVPQNLSSIDTAKGGMKSEEIDFWMNLAKKEYFFAKDRNKIYE